MDIAAHQEKETNEKTGKRKAGEEGRSILKRLRAALLRSFRGLHSEKIVCVRGVPWVTGNLGKANSHCNPNGFGDHTTTLRRLLIGTV